MWASIGLISDDQTGGEIGFRLHQNWTGALMGK
jgi:hypothetical protein